MKESLPNPVSNWRKWSRFIGLATLLISGMFTLHAFHSLGHVKRVHSMHGACPSSLVPPKLSPDMYLLNRAALHKELDQSFPDAPVDFLLASAPRPIRTDSDSEYPGYRQSSNIMYILGQFQISPALIHVTHRLENDGPRFRISLFLPDRSPRDIIFSGPTDSHEALKTKFQIDHVYEMSQFPAQIKNNRSLLIASPWQDVVQALGPEYNQSLARRGVTLEDSPGVLYAFQRARLVKSPLELEMIAFASRSARFAHSKVEQAILAQEDISEMKLYALFKYYSAICGGRLQAYNPIVGAGLDASVLHFRTGENEDAGYQNIPPDVTQWVLVDAAPEYKGYASDVTRTYPRSNLTHPCMKIVKEIVDTTQKSAIASYLFGLNWSNVDRTAVLIMTKLLIKHGFLVGDLDELIEQRALYAFMPHGLGHPIGLDVHDPIPYEFSKDSSVPIMLKLNMKSHDYPITFGSVNTIEPGMYFIEYLLDQLRNDTEGIGKWIGWDKVEECRWTGGYRIEDVVAIDEKGQRVILSDFNVGF